jgi:hypothetical protein
MRNGGPVVALEVGEEVLGSVGQKARRDDQRDVWPLCLRPSQQALQGLRWDGPRVVLAIGKPCLHIACAVDLDVIDVR